MTRRTALVALATLTVALLVLAPVPGHAADPLQPGDYVGTTVGGCTLNFVYDGTGANAGKVFMGTAAHCVERVGDLVQDETGASFGRVALIGNANIVAQDYAFIEVLPAHVSRVVAAVKGLPAFPTGYTTSAQTAAGDVIKLSGYGVGFDLTGPTREKRPGYLTFDDAGQYRLSGLDTYGDSGGPFMHGKSKKAFGVVSRLCLGACTSEGPTVEGILNKAAARGFTVRLRTIYG
jgi:hypothetical protein